MTIGGTRPRSCTVGVMMKKKAKLHQGDIFFVSSRVCWSYDFDDDRILINERWPLEELSNRTIVVGLEQRTIPYSEAYGIIQHHIRADIQMIKIIPPSGKIGWVMSHHLDHL